MLGATSGETTEPCDNLHATSEERKTVKTVKIMAKMAQKGEKKRKKTQILRVGPFLPKRFPKTSVFGLFYVLVFPP